jgi:hypothetical protein
MARLGSIASMVAMLALAVGCKPTAVVIPVDLATVAPDAVTCQQFACDVPNASQTCDGAQYCYLGAETPSAYYVSDGGVQYGCNPLPVECAAAPTCACVLARYRAGFCTCDDRCGITLFCSLA